MKLRFTPIAGPIKIAGLFAVLAAATPLLAQSPAAAVDPAAFNSMKIGLDTVWVLVTAMLVFWMNAGFALVESGLCRSKNCVNILAKNFIVFAISTVSFWAIGWGLMFGDGSSFFGLNGLFFVGGADNSPALADAYHGVYSALNWTGVPLWAKFFFQLVFAGTAATIVSGAVAERIKFSSFILFSFLLVAVIYPISGHWIWGGGWLGAMNFRDFAGSTVVHSVGGWAALAGVLVLGPRLGKFGKDGKVHPIPGHNMTSAALGVLILWLGWFGFNPGSTMAVGDGSAISHVLVNTNIAAATGSIGAALTAWVLLKKPDFSMILNGCLAGLVAITAPCAFVTVPAGAVIGLIAGIIVVPAVILFDKLKIDDPVGALSVHLVNGIWGTLATGLFYDKAVAAMAAGVTTETTRLAQTLIQLKGIVCVGAFAFAGSLLFWWVVKAATKGIRVTAEEETEGLDIGEHGNEAYPDFTAAH
ncbi:ammonium transporter [Horticoccus luteus]|uniref:Ammonium transporter n=1 Tax=Horticoccus luteus TaxID=2862869 RepID=A0A8F9TU42_9BACT|nr:ammonium transporter [Horticoccus luteus]QYM78155.1 ammonium transporter [Horticoccus luteus]